MHQGIYRFKQLIMGAGPASQEFHEQFRQSIMGLEGLLEIENDLSVYRTDQVEHDRRLQAVTKIAGNRGHPEKREVQLWVQRKVQLSRFGYKFSHEGMMADPHKIETISMLLETQNQLRTFLQMTQYNTMFMFDNYERIATLQPCYDSY